ncbi:DNA cytosine methyltransferase [Burkholderia sp. MBR-1]|uniref:DNA cytosine methyltransferase n=1 Tax=Burkholderia sp. MBR-1 TaxID=2732364 RepID=UPI0015EEB12B|nr:DNA cytosine methyltransferase [Burkholderia sp. MBR-1]QMI49935.1 DNA cytosine methyltransferase [Burkholderia sp. MBR-1]
MGFQTQTYWTTKVGAQRGRPRLWLEGTKLQRAGFTSGRRFEVVSEGRRLVLSVCDDGTRTVSIRKRGERQYPVIDINSRELLEQFEGMDEIRVVIGAGTIYILPLATENLRQERLGRLEEKMTNGEPISIASVSHGGGVMSHAIHQGLHEAGVTSNLVFANDVRNDLIEQAMEKNPVWSEHTQAFISPMEEVAVDPWALSVMPKAEALEIGIPCSGASPAGRAKRRLNLPESHPEVGHLVFAALTLIARIQPVVAVVECVPAYSSSASAEIMRTQLSAMGYDIHEAQVSGAEWNVLEHRVRWVLVAMTRGIDFDWGKLERPAVRERTLGEVLESLDDEDPRWNPMAGLKRREENLKPGHNFHMQIVDRASVRMPTLTKGIARNRSSDPKIRHPNNPDLLRNPTPREHAACKGVPPELIDGLSDTIAHEMLGQSVVYPAFSAIGRLIGQTLTGFVQARHQGVVPLTATLSDAAGEDSEERGEANHSCH